MAGKGGKPDLSGYNYGAIASLVLTADKSVLPRRDKEPDGAPTSLAGRIDVREMGSRVVREAPKDADKKRRKAVEAEREDAGETRTTGTRRKGGAGADAGFGLRTAETREVYQLMLAFAHAALGDQAQDVVRSAADTVLESLKNEGIKDFDKKKEVEDVLGPVANEVFDQLLSHSKKITDYNAEDEAMVDPDAEGVKG